MGFLDWFWDAKISGEPLKVLLNPPHEYGAAQGPPWNYEWYAGNFLVGMLLPQRSFLPGMTLFVWLLGAIVRLTQDITTPRKWRQNMLFLTAILAASLPFIHLHSLIALLVFGASFLLPWADAIKNAG